MPVNLKTFSFFHLNLAYSAIELSRRKDVIDRCYWPLLNLARKHQLPFGIEASAWTLEAISAIDPAWLDALRELITIGPCEFIGCGYAQVIGPLVPAEVNAANFRIGMERYEFLLGMRPKIALVNEQAYSAGLIPLYLEAGYECIIMEWNNPARSHSEWDSEWRYLPQYACGSGGVEIPLIWNKSVAFQKVQRYVHGEMELDEYIGYVLSHCGDRARSFPVYGNDVEVFDFRPGRYMTEAPLHGSGEWLRIEAMYLRLMAQPGIEVVAPSEVLEMMEMPGAGNRLHLETASHPVPVKKQDKYNLLRWAVTGRDDLGINTQCWQIFEAMRSSEIATDSDWMELCYLWSSDFRTHITDLRWADYRTRLAQFAETWSAVIKPKKALGELPTEFGSFRREISVARNGRFLNIEGERLRVRLNCLKGLALDFLIDRAVSDLPLIGTLHHGYYDSIQWMADYYSGHLVFESPGRSKVTDLNLVEPTIEWDDDSLVIKGSIRTTLGLVEKQWRIDPARGSVILRYRLHWKNIGPGSLRLGYLTLNPEAFSGERLVYETHNGGRNKELFGMANSNFDHGAPVSFLISANQALGLTTGELLIGDGNKAIGIQFAKSQCAGVGLLSHSIINGRYLCRFAVSLKELDDTSRGENNGEIDFDLSLIRQRLEASVLN